MLLHLSCCGGFYESTEELKNSNLNCSKDLVKTLQDSVLKGLLPFINSIENRLASLPDPRFKDKWIEDNVQKKEAMRLLQVQGHSRLGPCEEDSSSTSTDHENKIFDKKPSIFGFVAAGSKKRKPSNSVRAVERYFEEKIIDFDYNSIMYWKKKS